ILLCFFFSSRRRHTRSKRDWSSDVCSSDLRFARLVLPGTVAILPIAVLATTVAPFSTRWLWAGAIAIGGYVALNSLVHAVRVAYVCSREWKWFALNAIATQVIIVAGALSLV